MLPPYLVLHAYLKTVHALAMDMSSNIDSLDDALFDFKVLVGLSFTNLFLLDNAVPISFEVRLREFLFGPRLRVEATVILHTLFGRQEYPPHHRMDSQQLPRYYLS